MIVVVGSPIARRTDRGLVAAGMAVVLARVAAASGADVQLVGRAGEDPAGDAVVLSLADDRIGHVALLRDAGRATPLAPEAPEPDDVEPAADLDDDRPLPAGLTLDAADLELALRYLPDYRVLVVADPLEPDALAGAAAAAGWTGAQLIVILPPGVRPSGLPAGATILEAPPSDPDGAFATVVGAYATALDRGASPAEAFATASGGAGWTPVTD